MFFRSMKFGNVLRPKQENSLEFHPLRKYKRSHLAIAGGGVTAYMFAFASPFISAVVAKNLIICSLLAVAGTAAIVIGMNLVWADAN